MDSKKVATVSPSKNEHDAVPVLQVVSGFEAVERTFAQMLCDRAESEPHAVAFCSWEGGFSKPTTWSEYLAEVREAALGLHRLGLVTGDRVAVMSATRREWVIAALSILSIGAVPVGVYPTSSVPEVAHILGDAGATAVFVEGDADAAKVAAVADQLPSLKATIGFDAAPAGLPDTVATVTWDALSAAGRAEAESKPALFAELVEAGDIDQMAALFYTSGSTGAPKGVVHTHRTLQYSVLGFAASYPEIGQRRHDLVAFLGLSHVAPALIGVFAPIMTRLVNTYCTMDQRVQVLRDVRPTAVLWPPRLHEKLAGELLESLAETGRMFRFGYSLAMSTARRVSELRWKQQQLPWHLRVLDALSLHLVFLPLRARVGMDRVRVSWTASGTMTPNVAALWHMWGVDLRESGVQQSGVRRT